MSDQHRFVVKWYTRASRVRIVIAKFDGRWQIPGGPYPIPELLTLVGGLLVTLMLLPRLGQPVLTGALGIGATAIAVTVMRQMPYSPVKFATRVHRFVKVVSSPVSASAGQDLRAVRTTSVVRPEVEFLDLGPAVGAAAELCAGRAAESDRVPGSGSRDGLFDLPRSSAADLFT